MNAVIDAIFRAHPILENSTNPNQGKILMNWDSKIACYILKTMTNLDIPALCIHDSFIVQREHEEELITAMQDAYTYYSIPLAQAPIESKYSRLTYDLDDSIHAYCYLTRTRSAEEMDKIRKYNQSLRAQ